MMNTIEYGDFEELGREATVWIGRVVLGLFVIGLLLGAAVTKYAFAGDGEPWVTVSCCSYHHGAPQGKYREINPGFGFEYNWDTFGVAVGGYINSLSRDSRYLLGSVRTQPYFGNWRAGLAVGVIDGYERDKETKETKWTFGGAPFLSVEGKNWGTNILFAPPMFGNPMVVGIQFKHRFR